VRIVTWNINSVRLRIDLLKKLIEEHSPDVIALQETKVHDDLFPKEQINQMGYDVFFSGQKSYNGVALLTKHKAENPFSLELYNEDKRHIAFRINGIEFHNFYVPAGGDIPIEEENPKFKHKLEYIRLIKDWLTKHRSMSDKLVILGDLNIAPHEHDVWSSRQLRNVVSHTDIERALLLELQGSMRFIDSARFFVPMNEKIYTWWSYRNRDWEKSNRGRRLDHIWVSHNLKDSLLSINSVRAARNWARCSDHVPYILEMKE